MKARLGLALLVAAGLLTACAGSGQKSASEGSPSNAARYNVQLGVAYMQQGDLRLAREKLQRAVEQDPQLGTAHTYLALIYEQLSEAELAGTHYRKAVKVDSTDPDVRNLYGAYLCRSGEFKQAVKQFLSAASNPRYRTPEAAYTNAGVCSMRIPDAAAAESHFRRAIGINPRYPDALLRLSMLSLDNSNLLAARAFLQRYEDVADMTAPTLWLGVRIESELGDEEAEARYRQALSERFPESEEAGLALQAGERGETG